MLGRPEACFRLWESLRASERDAALSLTFVCTAYDSEVLLAARETGADVLVLPDRQPGDYARKINVGYRASAEPFVFTAASDVTFTEGWADVALALMEEGRWGVVGTSDDANPSTKRGTHSTHSLVRRAYADWCGTIDEPRKILHEGYHHNWVDNEFVQTAIARGVFAHCSTCVVRHAHPIWGTAKDDDTYRLGQEGYREDQALFMQRQKLWHTL